MFCRFITSSFQTWFLLENISILEIINKPLLGFHVQFVPFLSLPKIGFIVFAMFGAIIFAIIY
jgi:hypothetical protein